jgi:hypothetical protein
VPTAGNIGLELSAVFLASARHKYFEMLNRSIQINVVKTTVAKSDATLMMLLEGVHRLFPLWKTPIEFAHLRLARLWTIRFSPVAKTG